MTDDSQGEATLAICIRCMQRFPARERCPHCSDLSVATMPNAEDGSGGTWLFELLEKPTAGTFVVVARLGGFRDQGEAVAKAHEFLRHYVAQRRARRGP